LQATMKWTRILEVFVELSVVVWLIDAIFKPRRIYPDREEHLVSERSYTRNAV